MAQRNGGHGWRFARGACRTESGLSAHFTLFRCHTHRTDGAISCRHRRPCGASADGMCRAAPRRGPWRARRGANGSFRAPPGPGCALPVPAGAIQFPRGRLGRRPPGGSWSRTVKTVVDPGTQAADRRRCIAAAGRSGRFSAVFRAAVGASGVTWRNGPAPCPTVDLHRARQTPPFFPVTVEPSIRRERTGTLRRSMQLSTGKEAP